MEQPFAVTRMKTCTESVHPDGVPDVSAKAESHPAQASSKTVMGRNPSSCPMLAMLPAPAGGKRGLARRGASDCKSRCHLTRRIRLLCYRRRPTRDGGRKSAGATRFTDADGRPNARSPSGSAHNAGSDRIEGVARVSDNSGSRPASCGRNQEGQIVRGFALTRLQRRQGRWDWHADSWRKRLKRQPAVGLTPGGYRACCAGGSFINEGGFRPHAARGTAVERSPPHATYARASRFGGWQRTLPAPPF